jgi:hypothetical protein
MNHPAFRLALASFLVLSAACTAQVTTMTNAAQTGAGGEGGSGSTGSGNEGGAGGAAVCVPQPVDPNAPFEQPTCADLAGLTLGEAVVTDAGGDGKVSPGESATITVPLVETAGKGFNFYPGVTFSSDVAVVPDQGAAQFYAIPACQSLDAVAGITIPPDVAKGTVVKVKAQVSMLGATCPDAFSITVSIPIE